MTERTRTFGFSNVVYGANALLHRNNLNIPLIVKPVVYTSNIGYVPMISVPGWWNGRHASLKIWWDNTRASSTLAFGTNRAI